MLVGLGILLLSKISLAGCTCVVVVLLIPPGHIRPIYGWIMLGIFDISPVPASGHVPSRSKARSLPHSHPSAW